MKQTRTGALLVLLCLALLLLLPAFALADGSEDDPVEEPNGGSVTATVPGESISGEELDLPDSDTLFSQYVDKQLKPAPRLRLMKSSAAGNGLTGATRAIYTQLSALLPQVADGVVSSTVFELSAAGLSFQKTSWTAADLGLSTIYDGNDASQAAVNAVGVKMGEQIDLDRLLAALTADNPYNLYWFDKTQNVNTSFDMTAIDAKLTVENVYFYFPVLADYAAEGKEYTVDASVAQTVQTVKANAQAIVNKYSGKSDYVRLDGYRQEICSLVSYNYGASSGPSSNGSPWQLLWVFDGDPSTNVVCEGYAKAFQYLCDLTTFSSSKISCITVTGVMGGGIGAGNHMWNIVHMDDDKNYLVDVTNCDTGSVGATRGLFLTGYTGGSVTDGYSVACGSASVTYRYDARATSIFSNDALALSAKKYTDKDEGKVFTENGFTYCINAGGATITRYAGNETTVTLPSSLGGYPTRAIAADAFSDCTFLKSVVFPNTIERIEDGDYTFSDDTMSDIAHGAFSRCSSLVNVSIPTDSNLYYIGKCAFSDCTALPGITLPSSLREIALSGFSGCEKITELALPEGIRIVGQNALSGTGIKTLYIPASLTDFHPWNYLWNLERFVVSAGNPVYRADDGVLYINWEGQWKLDIYPCARPNEVYVVPDFLDHGPSLDTLYQDAKVWDLPYLRAIDIGKRKFMYEGECIYRVIVDKDNPYYTSVNGILYNKDMTTVINIPRYLPDQSQVVIPEGVVSVQKFAGRNAKFSSIILPDSLKYIEALAFEDNYALSSVSLPDTVTEIGDCAFSGCRSLKSFRIPSGVTRIRYAMFFSIYPTELRSVAIPSSVTMIESRAFTGCYDLNIYYQGTKEQWSKIQIEDYNDELLNATFHYNATPPTITGQPSSLTKDLGTTATFTVTASNATDYQWQYQRPGESSWNDVQVNGKSAVFNQTNVQKRHNGFVFRCKVTNAMGSTYSDTAKLTVVTTPPTITGHPSSVTVDLGTTATFEVVASAAASYQWQYQRPGESTWNDVQVNGKSAVFNQANVERRHTGFLFRCKVTNALGSTYSNAAKLTVATTAPKITSQPSSVTKDLGTTATFEVLALNATSYQWQYQRPGESAWNDVQVNGKSATFNQTNVERRHTGFLFRCKVTNALGSAYSNAAKLTVATTAPTVTGQPSSVTKDLGTTATFTVTASNATSYQWQYQRPGESTWNDAQVNGKSAVFNQANVERRHNGFLFRCKVTNAIGSVYSNTAKLTVATTAPTITIHPSSVTKDLGTTATFTVAASSATSYQWQYQRPGESTWNDVQVNGKSAIFNQANVERRHNGFLFRCKVTNAIGSVYSNTAKLTVATTAPTITGHPSNVSTALGTTATFTVTVSNATSYQWQYQRPGETTWNDVQVNGKAATFNQTNVATRHNGFVFRCKVTNAIGSAYSDTAKLTVVTTAPTITGQPADLTATLGTTATFQVTASNATSYQWQYKRPGETIWNDVQVDGKSATFNQTNVATRHNGFVFRCKVTNAIGSVYSDEAILTVE